jgi:hypothetical protein
MGLRPTKGHEETKWGGPPWTRSLALNHISSWPTWASAADQGVRPTWRLQWSRRLFSNKTLPPDVL